MEATREIYWNIGYPVIHLMYLLTFTALGVMVWGLLRKLPVWRQGKAEYRLNNYGKRCKRLISDVLGQAKVYRSTRSGILHTIFFWGFLLLLAGTLLILLQADLVTPLLHRTFLSGRFYQGFSLILDLAGSVALIMMIGLLARRCAVQQAGGEATKSDIPVLLLMIAILGTGFFVEGARIAATELHQNPQLAIFSPAGLLAAQLLQQLNAEQLLLSHRFLWWLHFVLTLGFFCAIPFTRLRHMFTISANSFLATLEPKGTLAAINLDNPATLQFGTATVADLSWKDIFDADACVSCYRCQERCPAYLTNKPLSPLALVRQTGELARSNPSASLIETIGRDAIWSCTTCGACQEICPATIGHVHKIIELRRHETLMEGAFAGAEARAAVTAVELHGNPFGLAHTTRGDWADGLGVPELDGCEEADILYFAGCYASFDNRNRQVASDFIRICHSAGIKVGILGRDERCCGEPLRKLGNEYLYRMMAEKNIARISSCGVRKIVTTCPHCFNTLARDYRELGLDLPVEHHSTFISRLMADKQLTLQRNGESADFTYHDSCYMGRYMDVIQEPRTVLKAAGGRLIEMEKSGYDSFCCGAGGGRILCEETTGTRINRERVRMAASTGAATLVSNCPFCLTMFEDGIKTSGLENRLVAKDLAEIIATHIAVTGCDVSG